MFDSFVSEQKSKTPNAVPFFNEVKASAGWQGYTTTKSLDTLKAEVMTAMSRLGGLVSGFEKGIFGERAGFRIHYTIESEVGKMYPGQMDIAALPVRKTPHRKSYQGYEKLCEQALRMALYNVAMCLEGMWLMRQLSPGYAPLIPWMLAANGKTVTQLWSESSSIRALAPPAEEEFIEGTVREIGE